MSKSKWPQIAEAVEDGRISRWLAKGLMEKTIAANLGVSVATWEKWKTLKPELVEAIKKGNRVIVQEIEDALVKRALGYDYTESKVYITHDADGRKRERKEVLKKHMPPDVGACCFILKNKARDEWRNDPVMADLRKMELELRREIAEGEGKLWGDAATSTEATTG